MNLHEKLKNKNTKKIDLCNYLSISRPTLDNYIRDNKIPDEKEELLQKFFEDREEGINYMSKLGETLIKNGYNIVPIKKGYKHPKGLKNWAKLQPNLLNVRKWASAFHGVGVLTGDVVAIDIDVKDEAFSKRLSQFCIKNIGAAPIRYGEYPKCVLVYRCEEPRSKIMSNKYTDYSGKIAQIEILGDGQQFVAYAEHPVTKEPYNWFGNKGLTEIKKQDLSIISNAQCTEIIEFFEKFKPTSYVLKAKVRESRLKKGESEDAILSSLKSDLNIKTTEIKQYLEELDPNDYDFWLQIGMGIHHQYKGSQEGFEIWDTWSSSSDKYKSSEMMTKWNSFSLNTASRDPITIRSIIHAAKNVEHLSVKAEWKKDLARDKNGNIKRTISNIKMILENDTEYKNVFFRDDFESRNKLSKSIHSVPLRLTNSCLDDVHVSFIMCKLSAVYDIEAQKNIIFEVINTIATDNRVHPVESYLDSLQWDRKNRVDTLFIDYLGEEDNIYTRACARLFLVAAVSRIKNPGVKFDEMVIISGGQGERKSTFFQTLAKKPEWFTDNVSMSDIPKSVENIKGKWIVEFAELQGFTKTEVRVVKSFASRVDDSNREAYKHSRSFLPRQCVFAGTDNHNEYLIDDTGNRRFLPLRNYKSKIDIEKLKGEIDQIWAEAVQIQKTYGPLIIPPEALKIALIRQEEASIDDGLKGIIEEFLERDHVSVYGAKFKLEKVCARQIMENCFSESECRNRRSVSQAINNIVSKLGNWKRQKNPIRFEKYGRQKGFIRVF